MTDPAASVTPIPLLVILGATAAGKSALAIALAQRLGGEVISADAMTVYRDMDIGTAKPDAAQLASVHHHLISVFDPAERCDLQRWFDLADAAVRDVHARGRVPVVAGGSPLYVKALLEGLSAGAPRDAAVRAALDERYAREGAEALHAELARLDPTYAAAHHANDQRRIVRALEVIQLTGQSYSSFHTTDGIRRTDLRPLLLGVEWPKDVLHQRINARVRAMFAAGLLDEVRRLRPRLSPEAMQAVGYKEVAAHLDGAYDLAFAEYQVAKATRHLAKHQATWYRRWRDIVWLPGDAPDLQTRAEQMARGHLGAG